MASRRTGLALGFAATQPAAEARATVDGTCAGRCFANVASDCGA